MPRLKALKKDYIGTEIWRWMEDANITAQDLADELNIARVTVYYRLANNSVDYEMLLTVIRICEVPDEEIIRVMKL